MALLEQPKNSIPCSHGMFTLKNLVSVLTEPKQILKKRTLAAQKLSVDAAAQLSRVS